MSDATYHKNGRVRKRSLPDDSRQACKWFWVALAAPLIGAFCDEPRVVPVIRVFNPQFILAGSAVILDAQLQRRMEFRNPSLLDLSGAIVATFIRPAMAFSGAGALQVELRKAKCVQQGASSDTQQSKSTFVIFSQKLIFHYTPEKLNKKHLFKCSESI